MPGYDVMARREQKKFEFHLTTHRLEALSDCIFAFAMTLLVLTLTLPDAMAELVNVKLHELLAGQAHKFFNYFLGFMLLAIFWMRHHWQFHWIKKTDSSLIWINVFILLFVALMPFSTDVVGDFGSSNTAEVLFATNLLVLGLLFVANWAYATRNHRLVDSDLDEEIVTNGLRRGMVTPIVSAVVIVLSFFIPEWSLWFYLSVPLILLIPPFRQP
ncbi:MAG: DUF1211 domain-containing protein [Chloroflexi bacterium]|nr:DUF1211 domain-containing protein [Chloroflexota bacterium]MBM3154806.1 DUF1211 domain-containing protein [Chloroflexota bacterium]MBM3172345.1 DUF1211 domain-containing protein [Chloroflexota bacterium]MBM3175962.1 DUF1211 domain-containing protein [Chloroflexota bacterium]MBM4451391.1 DUF1211 domain-containing protein [Chloroflexota bacterium]